MRERERDRERESVSVCVCVREREREMKNMKSSQYQIFKAKSKCICKYYLGNVHCVTAVRRVPRRLLGHPGHGRHRLHLLLHRQDPRRLPLRDGRIRRGAQGALQLQ